MQAEGATSYEDVQKIAADLQARVKCRPVLGIVCGSGLGKLADLIEDKETIPYNDIPGFPVSTVQGHKGQFVFGTLGGKNVVLMQGRAHCYEGHSPQKTALPIRVMSLLGIKTLIVTNAAGGLNRGFNAGDIMLIKDHINMPGIAGVNPLMGPNDERFGPRFPAMSKAYDEELRQLAKKQAEVLGYSSFLREGVYIMLTGPAYETIAESKFIVSLGADSVGMSTVPEVMVAVHCGVRVLGLSLITNKVVLDYDDKTITNHKEVLETAERRTNDMQTLVKSIVENM